MEQRILVPGQSCWRIEQARRLCVIVDAADYFRAVKQAMLQAQRSLMLVGWDFDTRVGFESGTPTLEGPNRLGDFLSWLVQQRPQLHIYVLKWDLGMLQSLGRGMRPMVLASWFGSRRLHFKLDGSHPVGSAHHQKIVVIDDTMAFCGGIDITAERWDTREHADDDPRRRVPDYGLFGPWHDATTAVDGPVARAIGEVARRRWEMATGHAPEPVDVDTDAWPECLEPTMREVPVGIARTLPEMDECREVREIEALYLAGIAAARRTIYLESQYLAARRLAEALAERLAEPGGPEVIIVLPEEIDSWLEHEAMDGARARLLHMLWRADRHGRLGTYYPVTAGGESIYVHAKIMVIDDVLLRVGSSNLNNRSMGYDTECDLAVEADEGNEDLRKVIHSVRDDLVREHLDVTAAELEAQLQAQSGSLLAAIGKLRSDDGRSLRAFDPERIAEDDSPLAESDLLDPEGLARPRHRVRTLLARLRHKR
ncbi:MAG TPA: phospholipase D-like domain-containing protein [Rhodanobacteraceae bacterium]|nr:phospholipase D-like domain-containing protein [Rhodanobacteraceae bacterium]